MPAMTDAEIASALEQFIGERSGAVVRVSAMSVLPGGASRKIYAFTLEGLAGPSSRALVLRMDPPQSPVPGHAVDEFALLAAAYDAGVSVPRVYWRGSAADGLGAGFIVMDRVGGEALGRHLLREPRYASARAALPAQLARELARIHAIDLEDPRLRELCHNSRQSQQQGSSLAVLHSFERLLASLPDYPQPVLQLCARWLERNQPPQSRQSVVHGDFRVGNVMFDEHGLTSVLDWELAHVGDPVEDIGWLSVRAWRFGADDKAVGGLCSRERLWALYEQESGCAVDPAAARYWEILGNWRWAAICILQAARHNCGDYPDVELASIGRRVAEVEQELLNLLEEAW